jgi:hypothetical protein
MPPHLTDSIDTVQAESVSRRTILVYEILDCLAAHAEDSDELHAEAIACCFIALAVAATGVGMPEDDAVSEYANVHGLVEQARRRLGQKATARELVEEIHLEQDA